MKKARAELEPFSFREQLLRITTHPVYADHDAFGDPHADVASLVATLARPPGQYAGLAFKLTADGLVVRVPEFGDLSDRVVPLKGNVSPYGVCGRTASCRGCWDVITY